MSMHQSCKTVANKVKLSDYFFVNIGVHQPKLTVICHYNGCFDRRCEGWFSDGVVVCIHMRVMEVILDKMNAVVVW